MPKTSSASLLKTRPPLRRTHGSSKTTFPIRWLRIARLFAHLLRGLGIAALFYPRWSHARRALAMRRWSRQLLRILGVRVRILAAPPAFAARCMMVSNHVSWLDIFVLASRYPAIFVAKSEIRSWPLVGWLCSQAGTLFIERGRRASAKQTNGIIASAITRGQLVSVFPEGTTTDGLQVGHFHAALLQPAIDAGATLQPVALRYLNAGGTYTDAANYVGDTSLLESIWYVTGEPMIRAELRFGGSIPPDAHRKLLATAARSAIQQCLDLYDNRPERAFRHPG
jgi:1-acyl-sn-glycerol-3-phosphate acyltransferase